MNGFPARAPTDADGANARPSIPGQAPASPTSTTPAIALAADDTLLIDSRGLEAGDALRPASASCAAPEIDAFRRETAPARRPSDQTITDSEILREVMNTVGQEGRLGEQIRCVVSVSMLTEGWDAQHRHPFLGVRAFGTQLLCEQVIGRALRRVSYDPVGTDAAGHGCSSRNTPTFSASRSPSSPPTPSGLPPAQASPASTPCCPIATRWKSASPRHRLPHRPAAGPAHRTLLDESRLDHARRAAPPDAINAAIVGPEVDSSSTI